MMTVSSGLRGCSWLLAFGRTCGALLGSAVSGLGSVFGIRSWRLSSRSCSLWTFGSWTCSPGSRDSPVIRNVTDLCICCLFVICSFWLSSSLIVVQVRILFEGCYCSRSTSCWCSWRGRCRSWQMNSFWRGPGRRRGCSERWENLDSAWFSMSLQLNCSSWMIVLNSNFLYPFSNSTLDFLTQTHSPASSHISSTII